MDYWTIRVFVFVFVFVFVGTRYVVSRLASTNKLPPFVVPYGTAALEEMGGRYR